MGRAMKNLRRGGNTQKNAPNSNPQIGGLGGKKKGSDLGRSRAQKGAAKTS